MGIYFRRTAGRGNLFLKRRASSKYPKIKTFRKLPAIRYIVLIDLSLPSSSTGTIKTSVFFFVACVILRIILNFIFLNVQTSPVFAEMVTYFYDGI